MKILSSLSPLPLLLILAFTPSAQAHHGQEFFLLNDAKVQSPGNGLIQSTFSFSDEGYADSLRLTSGIIIGVLPRTAISVIGDFSQKEGENWRYQSIEPSLLFDLTPKNLRLPVRFGISFGYQFAEGGDEVLEHSPGVTAVSGETMEHSHTASESEAHTHSSNTNTNTNTGTGGSSTEPHDHSTHDHGTGGGTTTPPAQPGGENNPDALTPEEIAAMNGGGGPATPPATAPAAATQSPSTAAAPKSKSSSKKSSKSSSKTAPTAHDHADAADAHAHSHSHENSIHNHDDNLFTSRFSFEADLTQSTLLVGNLICAVPEGGSAAWGYGLGLRQRLRPGLSVGVEALGDFNRHGYQEALGAVYWEPMHHVILKVGAGTGLSSTSPDATVRAGLLWMF